MKPSACRRVEREVAALIERDGDHCSLCKKPIEHNAKIYGGVTRSGETAMTSDCCSSKLKDTVVSGVRMDGRIGFLPSPANAKASQRLPPSEANKAVSRLQKFVTEIDRLGADIATRGGISHHKAVVNSGDSPWGNDDRKWFEANPGRSHRLRELFAGEGITLVLQGQSIVTPPPLHENQVLVRQVQPGRRIRKLLCRNLETPIPDIDQVLHAIFDIIKDRIEGVISVQEVADLAVRYASPTTNSYGKSN